MIRTFKLLLSLMLLQNAYAFVKQPSVQSNLAVTVSYHYIRTDAYITDNSMPAPTSAQLIDYNNDSYPDLFVCQFNSFSYPTVYLPLHFFKNIGNEQFVNTIEVDVTKSSMAGPDGILVADFNRDGKSDLFIPAYGTDAQQPSGAAAPGEQSRLFLSGSGNTLHDVTTTNLPQNKMLTHWACTGVIDDSGVVDIFLCNLGSLAGRPVAQFLINDGNGNFITDTTRIPTDITMIAHNYTSCALVDINGDGYNDLVLGGNGITENVILINDGTGHFYRDSKYILPPKLFGVNGVTTFIATADLNGDGKQELILATNNNYKGAGLQILSPNEDGTFTDFTSTDGIIFDQTEAWITKVYVVDFNGDGKKDLFLQLDTTNGTYNTGVKARGLLNNGDGTFTDISGSFGINLSAPTQAAFTAGDINGDGLADIIMVTPNRVTTLITQTTQVVNHIRTKNNLYNIQK